LYAASVLLVLQGAFGGQVKLGKVEQRGRYPVDKPTRSIFSRRPSGPVAVTNDLKMVPLSGAAPEKAPVNVHAAHDGVAQPLAGAAEELSVVGRERLGQLRREYEAIRKKLEGDMQQAALGSHTPPRSERTSGAAVKTTPPDMHYSSLVRTLKS
jgi:hypothetical protein